MDLVTLIVAAAVLFVGLAGVRRVRRGGREPAPEVAVTLSVLPTRTALVVLDVDRDELRPTLDRLVEHAVREAFAFNAVDVVEVRRRDGALLERRRRPARLLNKR